MTAPCSKTGQYGWASGYPGCHLLWAMVLFLFASLANAQSAAPSPAIPSYSTSLLIAGSGNTAFNTRFTALLEARLGPDVEVLPYTPELSKARPGTLVLALGPQAMSRVQNQQPRPPTLALMMTEDQFSGYRNRQGAPLSALYHNPPLLHQAILGQLILPQSTRVALLVQPGQEAAFDNLFEELADYGLQARAFIVEGDDSLIATLSRALSYGDFLLAQPDSVIYNPRTIKHILLTAYRRNRIVIGPNRAFVNAGALASTYTPISTVIDEAIAALQAYKATGQLPPPAYPDTLEVEVNRQVARSLNIPLPDTAYLTERLKERIRLGQEDSR